MRVQMRTLTTRGRWTFHLPWILMLPMMMMTMLPPLMMMMMMMMMLLMMMMWIMMNPLRTTMLHFPVHTMALPITHVTVLWVGVLPQRALLRTPLLRARAHGVPPPRRGPSQLAPLLGCQPHGRGARARIREQRRQSSHSQQTESKGKGERRWSWEMLIKCDGK